ncbi:MAG: methionine aminotransferase [Crocinitomix sp. MedPE-SWsnd]|jgi:methionine transaminase|nr:MAG: methionine aminotransferase [Crocinitomix sp. MedPE-SWsnd]
MESKLPDIGTTIFSVMSALANEHDAINLSQGFPNFSIDSRLKDLVKKALDDEQVQYAPMPGRLDLREAIAGKLFVQHGINVNPNTEITISAGATQGIYSAIAATIVLGDEVILFDPAYDCYDPSIRLHGGVPIHLELEFPNYNINWDEVEQSITPKTKMIIVNNPQNPAGTVWSKNDISRLEKICEAHPSLLVISDEVYEHIQFEGNHESVLKSELLRSRSFVTYSFGKTFHVTGWKLGYTIAPATMTTELRKMHQFNVFCVNNTMQAALANYMSSGESWELVKPFYTKKRELFLEGMKQTKFKPLACDGTYFCLYDYSDISNENDVDFAKRITKEHKVASIPVSVFYKNQTDNKVVRFCFAKEDETLNSAINNLCQI